MDGTDSALHFYCDLSCFHPGIQKSSQLMIIGRRPGSAGWTRAAHFFAFSPSMSAPISKQSEGAQRPQRMPLLARSCGFASRGWYVSHQRRRTTIPSVDLPEWVSESW
jgi:hypothetical protein